MLVALTVLAVALVILIAVWDWDWFLPLVERQASASFGRKVTASHLHVRLGRVTTVLLDDVVVPEPAGFPGEPPVARIGRLSIGVDVLAYLHGAGLVIPSIDLDQPNADIISRADQSNNYTFKFMQPSKTKPASSSPHLALGLLTVEHGRIDVAMAKLKAKFHLDVHTTQSASDPTADRVVVDAHGTYAAQPITGELKAGALLTIRDKTHPYPIDLKLANGPTTVSLDGTVNDPLHFAGANLRLVFAGPDMALLFPLTGVPIPTTPPYHVAGKLDYESGHVAFRHFEGRVGTSDLGGDIIGDTATSPPSVTANLHSHQVNLVDLGGFIGAAPGHAAENRASHQGTARAAKEGNILPTAKLNIPKLKSTNVDLTYHGDRIEGRFVPLDNIDSHIVIRDGAIDVSKLDFGVGRGTLASSAKLTPAGQDVRAEANVDVRHVDLSHLLNATHVFHGTGIVGGQFKIHGTGSSIASIFGNGSGGLSIFMRDGGNISALLPDILGLEFGNAVLSALGIPQRTDVQCFVADLPIRQGILSTDLFVLQTKEARSTGSGTVDFRNDTLNYALTTRSTGFSVGSLPGAINLTGPMSSPTVLPGAEIAARGAATVALGIAFFPAAILPTIQLGVGKSQACENALRDAATDFKPKTAATQPTPSTAPGPASVHRTPAQIRRIWRHRLAQQ